MSLSHYRIESVGEDEIIVCGLGPSIRDFAPHASNYYTIGVNDMDRYFVPDHLLVLDYRNSYSEERREYIVNTRAPVAWVTRRWPFRNGPEVRGIMQIRQIYADARTPTGKKYPILDEHLGAPQILSFNNSASVATHVAYKMGAKKIGLIGVDFVGHVLGDSKIEFFIGPKFKEFGEVLAGRGVELVLLSEESLLRPYLPYRPLAEF
jgi:hypothetical protein